MTTGANALLTWFHQPLAKIRTMTDRTTDASPRQYRIHVRRTCYRCQQEGHYARNCPRAVAPKPAETKMEKMQSLLRSMTPNATHILVTALRNTTAPADPLSRETSPRTNQTHTESPPSREADPHPSKSRKKLAQALKKHAEYEAKRRI